LKFKLDENLGTLGRDVLTSAGHGVATAVEQDLSGVSDNRLYEVCCHEHRVLITLDHDFGQILRFPPEAGAGIVVLECPGRLVTGLRPRTNSRVRRCSRRSADRS